jgi:ribosome-associated toxin RatA of RatAB toxin-antitoxin module
MRTIERSVIVPFPAAAMYDLVADVPAYPQFLPGCSAARIHAEEGDTVLASMALARGPLQLELKTRNTMRRPTGIAMALAGGPFRELGGQWTFTPLGADGSRVDLRLEFAFSNRVMDRLLGPVFEALAGDLVAAFARRARVVYAAARPAPQER